MKKILYKLLIVSFLLIISGCEKESDDTSDYSDPVTEGIISFKLNGEPMEFQVTNVGVPLAYECDGTPSSYCRISLGAENNQWGVALEVYKTQTGQFNCEDDEYVLGILMVEVGTTNILFSRVFGAEYCTLNITALNNLSMTEQGSPGRLGKIQGTFEFTTSNSSGDEYVLTDGYFSASKI